MVQPSLSRRGLPRSIYVSGTWEGRGSTAGSGVTSQFWHCGTVVVVGCADIMEAKTRAENRSDLCRSYMSANRK